MPTGTNVVTDGKMILVWRGIKEGERRVDLGKKYKVSTHTIGQWYLKIQKNPALMAVAKSGKKVGVTMDDISDRPRSRGHKRNGAKPKKTTRRALTVPDVKITESLKDRIKFLEWWNMGERRGYVDRLLKQIQE